MSRWWSPMNVYIYLSPSDMNNVEGLCGHFNGNWSDDFVHRNGAKTLSHSYYWRWWLLGGDPVVLSDSWKVSDNESLLNPDRIAKLSTWNEEEQYCICPKTLDGDREPICHRMEADSCVKIEEKSGKRFGTFNTRRDQHSINYLDENDLIERLRNLKTKRIYKTKISRVKRQVEASDEDFYKAAAECQQCLVANCNGEDAALVSSIAGNNSYDSEATASVCLSVATALWMQGKWNDCRYTCDCFEGFDPLSNCKVNVSEPPEIISTTGGGVCHQKVKSCEALRYTTKDGCSMQSVCKMTTKEFYESGKTVTHETTYVKAICYNGWDAYCPIPFNSRRKRSVDQLLVVEPLHCLIAATCISSDEKDPGKTCTYCNTDKKKYAWKTNGCEEPQVQHVFCDYWRSGSCNFRSGSVGSSGSYPVHKTPFEQKSLVDTLQQSNFKSPSRRVNNALLRPAVSTKQNPI
ncbi:hypothetical protein DPMN_015264 [Dreissena polymorpha]|uniref:VWFD domain-containing protein n=1 Tax=Dreissena polymorpha TaxID=45954 RepID=A0A9D4NB65_DREPO|nr:hypothetical protein DPMN_015264 [Dreissena polymorpha]